MLYCMALVMNNGLYFDFHKTTDILLLGAGVTMGILRFASKRRMPTAANWGVFTFMGVSAVSFEACQMERKQKLEKIRMIVKATDSRPKAEEKMVITERGKNGAFNVVIETPAQLEDKKE